MGCLRKLVALLCIGIVLVAAFTPGVASHHLAVVLEPVWGYVGPQTLTFAGPHEVRNAEQTRSLVNPLLSRPPPFLA